jgi:hypothetical protein
MLPTFRLLLSYRDLDRREFRQGFQMVQSGAEKGNARGMHQVAHCYGDGKGVEQNLEQTIYWYEKYLELEDDEDTRIPTSGLFAVSAQVRFLDSPFSRCSIALVRLERSHVIPSNYLHLLRLALLE